MSDPNPSMRTFTMDPTGLKPSQKRCGVLYSTALERLKQARGGIADSVCPDCQGRVWIVRLCAVRGHV